jgi:hypothetical protein
MARWQLKNQGWLSNNWDLLDEAGSRQALVKIVDGGLDKVEAPEGSYIVSFGQRDAGGKMLPVSARHRLTVEAPDGGFLAWDRSKVSILGRIMGRPFQLVETQWQSSPAIIDVPVYGRTMRFDLIVAGSMLASASWQRGTGPRIVDLADTVHPLLLYGFCYATLLNF